MLLTFTHKLMSNALLSDEGLTDLTLTCCYAWIFPGPSPCPSCALYVGVLDLCVYLCVYENLQPQEISQLRGVISYLLVTYLTSWSKNRIQMAW